MSKYIHRLLLCILHGAHSWGNLKEIACLTSNNKNKNHASDILSLLEAVPKTSQVAKIHFQGHKKGKAHIIKCNQLADQDAKREAKEGDYQAMTE